jgi:hypothetical protein
MSNQFYEGQEVKAIFWPNDDRVEVGQFGVEKIVVVHECGQMAGVPWFAVYKNGKIDQKFNAASLDGVDLINE